MLCFGFGSSTGPSLSLSVRRCACENAFLLREWLFFCAKPYLWEVQTKRGRDTVIAPSKIGMPMKELMWDNGHNSEPELTARCLKRRKFSSARGHVLLSSCNHCEDHRETFTSMSLLFVNERAGRFDM